MPHEEEEHVINYTRTLRCTHTNISCVPAGLRPRRTTSPQRARAFCRQVTPELIADTRAALPQRGRRERVSGEVTIAERDFRQLGGEEDQTVRFVRGLSGLLEPRGWMGAGGHLEAVRAGREQPRGHKCVRGF